MSLKTLAMRREARAKTAAGRNRRRGGACGRIRARLKNATHLLWKSLRPTARKRSVIVDVNVGHHITGISTSLQSFRFTRAGVPCID
jgi:hypothetical protein